MTTDEKKLFLWVFNVSVAQETLEMLSDDDCKAIVKIIRKAEKKRGKTVVFTKKSAPVTVTDDSLLQHVGYTDEQCGREK